MKIEEILTELIQSVTAVKNFAVEQAPDVIVQLLAWNFYSSLILGGGSLLIMIGGWLAIWKLLDWKQYDQDNNVMICLIFGAISLIGFIPLTFCSFAESLKIYIAPKLYLIEYAASLLK